MILCAKGIHENPKKFCQRCYMKEWRLKNSEYVTRKRKEFKQKNPDWHREYRNKNQDKIKDYMLKYNFKISLDEYNKKLSEQNNVCWICKSPPGKGKLSLHVDHSHINGKVRDLLCGKCNRALGLLKEDPLIIKNLLEYLEKWK